MFHNIFILNLIFSQLLKYTLLQIRNLDRPSVLKVSQLYVMSGTKSFSIVFSILLEIEQQAKNDEQLKTNHDAF